MGACHHNKRSVPQEPRAPEAATVDEDALLDATLLLDETSAELLDEAGATELLLEAAGADVGTGGCGVGAGWAQAVATMPRTIRTKSANSA